VRTRVEVVGQARSEASALGIIMSARVTDMRIHRVLPLVVSLLLPACAQPVRPVSSSTVDTHVFKRNYVVGERASVFVGEPVVAVKDYYELRRHGQTMRATKSFRVTQALAPWQACDATTPYPVISDITKDGKDYKVVLVWNDANFKNAVLVGTDGRPYEKLMGNALARPVLMAGHAKFDPPDVTFVAGPDDVSIDSTRGFTNFELIYGGTDGRSFTLTYREYTPADLIRPGFTQTLTYENTSPTVRFRAVQLQLHEITSERLSYTVVADGLGGSP